MKEEQTPLEFPEILIEHNTLKRVEVLFEAFVDAYNKAVAESEANHQHLSKMMNDIMLNSIR